MKLPFGDFADGVGGGEHGKISARVASDNSADGVLSGDVSAVVEIAVNALNVGADGGCGSDNSADGRAVSVNGTFVKAADNTLWAGRTK